LREAAAALEGFSLRSRAALFVIPGMAEGSAGSAGSGAVLFRTGRTFPVRGKDLGNTYNCLKMSAKIEKILF